MARHYKETGHERGTQLIFCDVGTPGTRERFNVYVDLKSKLVSLGIDPGLIALIHDCKTDEARGKLFRKVRDGQIRVLIGSTGRMGEGVNAQDRVIALHHLDCPWRPSDIVQRDGRGRRQGNRWGKIWKYIYTTEGSFDLFLFNLLRVKAEQFTRLLRGDPGVRSFSLDVDPTYAETAALAAGDPTIREKLEVDLQVQRLEALERSHMTQVYQAKIRAEEELQRAQHAKLRARQYQALRITSSCGWRVGDKSGTFPQVMAALGEAQRTANDGRITVSYQGVPVTASWQEDYHSAKRELRRHYSVATGEGLPDFEFVHASDVSEAIDLRKQRAEQMLAAEKARVESNHKFTEAAKVRFLRADELKKARARQSELLAKFKNIDNVVSQEQQGDTEAA